MILRWMFDALGNKGYKFSKEDHIRSLSDQQSQGEKVTRRSIESIFGRPFPQARPEWLRNPKTGKCLELDCYNEELKLAVEYDGAQHSMWIKRFHKSYGEFKAQQYRDIWKEEKCRVNGVTLIRVPHYIQIHSIYSYLIQELTKAKFVAMFAPEVGNDFLRGGNFMVNGIVDVLKTANIIKENA
jgi:hypothetical protein